MTREDQSVLLTDTDYCPGNQVPRVQVESIFAYKVIKDFINFSGHTSGISLQFRSGSLRSLSRESRDRDSVENNKPARRRSFLLNTSYSSEELVASTGKKCCYRF